MRKTLVSAAMLSLAVILPAIAQQSTPNPAWPWEHEPGTGQSGPASGAASNLGPDDTRSQIAPHLPQPSEGEDGVPNAYLRSARSALAQGKTGLAQQALEMAETRLLDRSTLAGTENTPDRNPKVRAVHRALDALGRHDRQAADNAIEQALEIHGPMPARAGYAPQVGMPPQAYPSAGYPQQRGYPPMAYVPQGAPQGYPPSPPPAGYMPQQAPPGYAPPPPPPGYQQ